MRGHFPNNPWPPLVLAYGFIHSCFISGSRPKLIRGVLPLTLRAPPASKFVPDEFVATLKHWTHSSLIWIYSSSVQNGDPGQKTLTLERTPMCPYAKPSFEKLFGIGWQLFERSEFCHAQIDLSKRGNPKGKHGLAFCLVRFILIRYIHVAHPSGTFGV